MKKKNMKFKLISVLLVFLMIACSAKERKGTGEYREKNKKTNSYQDAFHAFDTECTVTIYGKYNKEKADIYLGEVREELLRYDSLFSKTDKNSDVYKVNNREGDTVKVAKEVGEMFIVAKEMYEWSSGYFDVSAGALFNLWDVKNRTTLPSISEIADVMPLSENFDYDVDEIQDEDTYMLTFYNDKKTIYDFGALVKGYASDTVKELLASHEDIEAGILNLGGNVCCIGELKDREDGNFHVGIYKPFSEGEVIETVNVKNKFVITSGNYQRYFKVPGDDRVYHHIINPKTGYPTNNGIDSVTIISNNGVLGDYLSTSCMILGEEYSKKLIDGCMREFNDNEIKAIYIYSDGHISRYEKEEE